MTGSYVGDSTPWDDIVAAINEVDSSSADDGPPQYSLELMVEISRNTKIFEKLFYVPLIRTIFINIFFIIQLEYYFLFPIDLPDYMIYKIIIIVHIGSEHDDENELKSFRFA